MREIIFRGKTITSDWIYGGIVHQTDFYGEKVDRYFIIDGTDTQDYDIGFEHEVIPSTVGQYTGLTDNNGVKIFDGDFLSATPDENNYVYLVVYEPEDIECGGFGVEDVILDESHYADYSGELTPLSLFLKEHVPMMVIGNVHDNPKVESCRWRNTERGLSYNET